MTATISEANKKGLQPSAIDDLTEELVGESVKLLASSADVTPDRQALVEPTVRDLLVTRGREYFHTDPTSFRNSFLNTFARNVVQTWPTHEDNRDCGGGNRPFVPRSGRDHSVRVGFELGNGY